MFLSFFSKHARNPHDGFGCLLSSVLGLPTSTLETLSIRSKTRYCKSHGFWIDSGGKSCAVLPPRRTPTRLWLFRPSTFLSPKLPKATYMFPFLNFENKQWTCHGVDFLETTVEQENGAAAFCILTSKSDVSRVDTDIIYVLRNHRVHWKDSFLSKRKSTSSMSLCRAIR